jgi:hypothetical protein
VSSISLHAYKLVRMLTLISTLIITPQSYTFFSNNNQKSQNPTLDFKFILPPEVLKAFTRLSTQKDFPITATINPRTLHELGQVVKGMKIEASLSDKQLASLQTLTEKGLKVECALPASQMTQLTDIAKTLQNVQLHHGIDWNGALYATTGFAVSCFGAWLMVKGVQHALLKSPKKDNNQQPPAPQTSPETNNTHYRNGFFASCIGAGMIAGGLYCIQHNPLVN